MRSVAWDRGAVACAIGSGRKTPAAASGKIIVNTNGDRNHDSFNSRLGFVGARSQGHQIRIKVFNKIDKKIYRKYNSFVFGNSSFDLTLIYGVLKMAMKKIMAVVGLVLVSASVYASTCTGCSCVTVKGSKLCVCSSCRGSNL